MTYVFRKNKRLVHIFFLFLKFRNISYSTAACVFIHSWNWCLSPEAIKAGKTPLPLWTAQRKCHRVNTGRVIWKWVREGHPRLRGWIISMKSSKCRSFDKQAFKWEKMPSVCSNMETKSSHFSLLNAQFSGLLGKETQDGSVIVYFEQKFI